MRQWLYFITDKSGNSYQKANGVVTKTAQRTPLEHTPDGWQDISIGWERDMTKIGVVRNFSIPLRFVRDGADILRSLFYGGDLEQEIYLVITRLRCEIMPNSNQFRWYYEHFYKGEMDLTAFKDDGTTVSVSIMEGGIDKKIKANMTTQYEIPLVDLVRVGMDGLSFDQKSNFLIPAVSSLTTSPGGPVPITFLNNEALSFDVIVTSQELSEVGTAYRIIENTSSVPVEVRLVGQIAFTPNDNPQEVRILLRKNSDTIRADVYDHPSSQLYTIDYNETIILDTNDVLRITFLIVGTTSINPSFVYKTVTYQESRLQISYTHRFRATTLKALKPSTVFKKLIEKITGSDQNCDTSYLEKFDHLLLTPGDAVRGIEGAVLKTSLNDFLSFCRVVMAAGFGVEGDKATVQAFTHFLNATDPLHLGKVKNLTVTYATDLVANTVKIGYEPFQTDDVNGKLSFNNSYLYSSPITRITRELTLVSPYIADPYAIELTRINLEGKTTTDNAADNTVFVVATKKMTIGPLVFTVLKRANYNTLEGVPTDTVFNIEDISPKRVMERHHQWLNSIFYGYMGKYLTFQTTEKNRDLKTVKGTLIYDEDSDYEIGTNRLFLPIYFDIDVMEPAQLVKALEENPNRCMDFEWEGVTYQGFLIKAGIQPDTKQEQSYRLLATINNDIKKLI